MFSIVNFEYVNADWVHALPSLTLFELDKNAL